MPLSDEEIKELLEKAKAYEKLGNYEEALKVYEKIIEQKPDDAEAWKNKGDVLSRLNRYEEARNAYERAAEYYLASSIPWKEAAAAGCYFSFIAKYIFSIEAKEEYSRDLKKFARELNNGTISPELRGFFKENKYPLSEKAKVEKIEEAEVGGIGGKHGKWRIKDEDKVYILRGFYSEINIFLENAPLHPHYYIKHAALLPTSRLDEAIGDMDRAIELNPDQGYYYRYRGELLLKKVYKDDKEISGAEKKSIFGKVIADYKTSLEKDPSDPEIWLSLIELNILLHNWDDAISIYGSCRPFIQTNEDQLIRAWLGCLALSLPGDPIEEEDKRPLYDQTIQLESTSKMLRISSNSFINEIQEKEEYKEKWGKAIEIHKLFIEHLDDWEDRGDILERLRCYKEAVEAYNRAIGLKPDRADLIYQKKGDILNKFLKHYEEAIQAYDRAIELGYSYFDYYRIWYKKANLLTILERYEEALNAFNKVEELNSGFFYYCKLWIDQGILLEKLGRYDEALKVYNEDGGKKAWYFKGNLYKKLNAYDEAIKAFDKAIEVNPDYYHYRYTVADAWYGKANTYSLKNDRENALASLSKAIELNPKYKEDAKQDEVFKNLWDDEDFKKIIG